MAQRGPPVVVKEPARPRLPPGLPAARDEQETVHEVRPRLSPGLPVAPNEQETVREVRPRLPPGLPAARDDVLILDERPPRLSPQLPATPNGIIVRKQTLFNGAWRPFDDPLVLAETDYADLQNFRYKDRSLITVLGYTRINTAAHATYVSGRSGIQFIKSIVGVQTAYVLAQVENAGLTASAVLLHSTAIPNQGNFAATALLVDGSGAGLGRFDLAPDGNVAYANGVQAMIWGSTEHRCAAFIVRNAAETNVRDFTAEVQNTLTTTGNLAVIDTGADAPDLIVGSTRPLQGIKFYVQNPNTAVAAPGALTAAINVAAGNLNGAYTWRVTFVNATGETQGGTVSNSISPANQQADLTGIPTGPSGTTARRLYRPIGGGASYLRVTELADNVTTTYTDNIADGALGAAMPTTNSAGITMAVSVWASTGGWTAVTGFSDGTVVNGRTLAQTGTMSFDSTDTANARLRIEGERALYFYRIRASGPISGSGNVSISHVTVDAPFQSVKDVWDNVYRTPVMFLVDRAASDTDYTLEVNEESAASVGIAANLDALNGPGNENFTVLFTTPVFGLRIKMSGTSVNTAAATMSVYAWTGAGWTLLGNIVDGTALAGATLGRSGTIWWRHLDQDPAGGVERLTTIGGVEGYAYRFTPSAALSATVRIDAVYAIPSPRVVPACRFPFFFQDRLLLMGLLQENESNAAEFSLAGAPDVWNGRDTSDYGQRLRFGSGGDLLAAIELFNRYAGTLQHLAVVCKATDTLILTGNDPVSFTIIPISRTVGCPAPLTMDAAEVNFSVAEDAQRHVAMWCSWNGPVLFDGSVLVPIAGVEPYFNPSDTRYINIAAIENARGWFDPLSLSPEYNLTLPSGAGQTTCNVWLVYDVKRQKWTRKVPVAYPQMSIRVRDANGRIYLYGWRDSTGLMMRLEDGFTWDSTAITARIDTADLRPTQELWDISRLRYLKLLARRTTAAIDCVVTHFADGATGGTALQTFDLETGTARYRRMTGRENREAYSHQLRFEVVTSAEQVELLGWGGLMEVVREDL